MCIGLALMLGFAAFAGSRLARRHCWGGGGGWGGWRRHHFHHHGYHATDDDLFDGEDHGGGWGGWHRGGPGFVMRGLMNRIGVRPDQEEAVRNAAYELRDGLTKLRGEGKRTRADIAQAMRGSAFDEVQMGELFARHDSALEELRKTLVGSLARAHDALDERQRQRLADLIAQGPRAFGGRGW
jgi:uncharacterized membrane-anchored protein